MLQNPKVVQTPQIQSPTPIQNIPTSPSPPILKQCFKISRRGLSISTKSSLLLLLGSQALDPFHLSKAFAEDETPLTTDNIPTEITATTSGEITDQTMEQKEIPNETTTTAIEKVHTKQAFLDISINGEPIGRIVIELNTDSAPAGVARFSGLVSGAAGISYRRKDFIKITPNYVQHGGVRSYGVDAELAKQTGTNLEADNLIAELESENEKSSGTKNVTGSVGIVVRDPTKPPPKMKLVARKGKLEIDEEQVGKDPNGTEFVIATKDSPELDASTLVIGKVLEGMEVVKKISQVKTVNENTSSPISGWPS